MALALDRPGRQYRAEPNPRVGCVIVDAGGVLGRGHTQPAGGPHAEVMALRDAAARGHVGRGRHRLRHARALLAPRPHGPCCDALIAAGIGKVVASHRRPEPAGRRPGLRAPARRRHRGRGRPRRRRSARTQHRLLQPHGARTPWVRMKVAASLDGKTALDNGVSQWITARSRARRRPRLARPRRRGADRRRHRARRRPAARRAPGRDAAPAAARDRRSPPRRRRRTRASSTRPAPVLDLRRRSRRRRAPRRAAKRAAPTVALPARRRAARSTWRRCCATWRARDVNELHVEAGHKLNGSLLREGLVDELLVYLAPKLLGDGRGHGEPASCRRPADRARRAPWRSNSSRSSSIGPDLRIVARVAGRDRF